MLPLPRLVIDSWRRLSSGLNSCVTMCHGVISNVRFISVFLSLLNTYVISVKRFPSLNPRPKSTPGHVSPRFKYSKLEYLNRELTFWALNDFGLTLVYALRAQTSLTIPTEAAPNAKKIPDNNSIDGMCDPSSGNSAKLANEATICGRQIELLNKPR